MFSKWTSHLKTEEDKQNFRLQVLSARDVLDRQKQFYDEEEQHLDYSELSVRQFELPNWEYQQAFKLGYRAAIRDHRKLIDLDQQETDIDRTTAPRPTGA